MLDKIQELHDTLCRGEEISIPTDPQQLAEANRLNALGYLERQPDGKTFKLVRKELVLVSFQEARFSIQPRSQRIRLHSDDSVLRCRTSDRRRFTRPY